MWEGSIKLYCISSPASHNGGDFLEPSLGPPHWGRERFRSWAGRLLLQPRGKGSRETLGRGKGNVYDY